MGKINVDFYETADGKCPVEEFIESLDIKMHAKVLRQLICLKITDMNFADPIQNQ